MFFMKRLDDTQMDLLMTNLDADGRLSCLKAFKVARLIGVKPKEMDAITKSLNIKITNCELGVFGKLKFIDMDDKIYNKLSENFNQGNKVECQVAWHTARKKRKKIKKSKQKKGQI
eukprot:TRINITY_DN14405_c0_g1_i2.p1 TRINITY_DN14405_c0_g1~~TRINITY_DN14405_c0_g1_i2.p1  ORF type:complete len:116 (-),score=10.31 TRINITY_DN14405_c0_g1_i2:55-402(-)